MTILIRNNYIHIYIYIYRYIYIYIYVYHAFIYTYTLYILLCSLSLSMCIYTYIYCKRWSLQGNAAVLQTSCSQTNILRVEGPVELPVFLFRDFTRACKQHADEHVDINTTVGVCVHDTYTRMRARVRIHTCGVCIYTCRATVPIRRSIFRRSASLKSEGGGDTVGNPHRT